MATHWGYSSVPGSRHGTMRCTACGKQIESGRYRHRIKSKRGDWGYVAQHAACTPDDPEWAAQDQREADNEKWRAALSEACKAFKAEWGLDELDDYIMEQPHEHP